MTLPRFTLNLPTVMNTVGVLIIAYLLVVLGQTIKRNYDLNNQITHLRAETGLLEAQRDQLSYDIAYYNTGSYRDREARSKLGLQLPGESVVIVQHPTPTPAPAGGSSKITPTHAPSHFSDWLDFLLGRS